MTNYTYDIEINTYYSKKRIIIFYTYPNGNPTVAIFFADWYYYTTENISDSKLLSLAINQYHSEWPNSRYDINGVKLDKLTTRNISYHETFNSPHSASPWEGDDPFDPTATTTYNVKTGQWEDMSSVTAPETPLEADFEIPEPDLPPYNQDLEGQTAQADMEKKIDEITTTIQSMKKIAPPTTKQVVDQLWDTLEPQMLTHRQIAKKIMLTTSGIVPGVGEIQSVPKVDQKTAHLAIYGKLMYDSNGQLVDDEVKHPECVNWTKFKKNISSDTSDSNDIFPMKDKVKNMKLELKNAIKGLGSKMDDLSDGITKSAIEIPIGAASFIDAATNLPKPQPSLAVASILGIFSSISKLQAKVIEIVPLLSPLQFLFFLLPQASPIIGQITNIILTPMTIIVTSIGALTAIIQPILSLIPSPTQVSNIVKQSTSASIEGHVVDATNLPIVGVSIKVNDLDPVVTDDTGYYKVSGIDATGGTATLIATAPNANLTTMTITVTGLKSGITTNQEIWMIN